MHMRSWTDTFLRRAGELFNSGEPNSASLESDKPPAGLFTSYILHRASCRLPHPALATIGRIPAGQRSSVITHSKCLVCGKRSNGWTFRN